jgi:hypothetical protein
VISGPDSEPGRPPAVSQGDVHRPTPQERLKETGTAVTGWASSITLMQALGASLGVVVAAIPVFMGVVAIMPQYQLLYPERWFFAWILSYALKEGSTVYKRGKRREAEAARFDSIHSSLAASVDRIARELIASPDRRLDIRTAETLIISVLSRIKEYAENVLAGSGAATLRVTLAVPWKDPMMGYRPSLRVWCYDQPYTSSNWTVLPLPLPGEQPLPGSPTAFVNKTIEIIHDISLIPRPNKFRGTYKSVLSLPVTSGGSGGEPLAVVNIDSNKKSYFVSTVVDTVVYPKIAPALNLLALIFLLIEPGAKYEFGN